MLPDHVYRNYYNRPCEECGLVEINQGQTAPSAEDEWAECGQCNKLLCEDCMGDICDECQEAICQSCKVRCRKCGPSLLLHKECGGEHRASCNSVSRARRAFDQASERVNDKEKALEATMHRVTTLKRELVEAKKAKAGALHALRKAQAGGQHPAKKRRV